MTWLENLEEFILHERIDTIEDESMEEPCDNCPYQNSGCGETCH